MVEIDSISDLLCNIKEAMKSHFYPKSDMDTLLDAKSDVDHIHDDRYFTETEVTTKLNAKSDTNHTHPVDSSLSSSSTNPVQNKILKEAIDDKANANHTHAIDTALNNSSTNPVQNKVINSALSNKANANHTHTINNITGLADDLADKADKDELVTVDNQWIQESTNPIESRLILAELDKKAGLTMASSSNRGLMSSADKIKLDGITEGAKAKKRIPGLYISSDKDATNQNLIAIDRGTRLKVILFDQESVGNPADSYPTISNYQIPNTTIQYTINGANRNIDNGGTIGINLDPGTYDMHFMFVGSGNYYQIYRSIKLRVD
ncbi:MAG: hypothetical protein IJ104_00500 [Methanobrevibacter sp.]|nr:hypothetical protein [Methanobrevibacter sp.]